MSYMRRAIARSLASVLALVAGLVLAGCNRSGVPAGQREAGVFRVVAAENFWGSIAAQVAGSKATVTSILVNPDADPHNYEPTAGDARLMAAAQMAIVNGIGYDRWASRLLQATRYRGRVVLDVGRALELRQDANPHQWYSPVSVHRVIGRILAGYDTLDPSAAAYFAQRARSLQTHGLARYDALRGEIRSRYAGVAVGYSESIFQPLGEDLRLRLLTPANFAKAIAEGSDVTAQDKQTVDEQLRERRIKVWVFNSQNITPDVQRLNELARREGIPIATVSETLSPASESFEQWQVAQLEGLIGALHRATGR